MKPPPPPLPPNVDLKWIHHDALTNQVDARPQRGQCWAVRLDGELIGEVHLGKTKYRLQTITGKPHRQAWMVNGERKSPEYDNRNTAVMGLLEITRGRDPSRWHTPAVPRDHINAGHSPIIEDDNDDNNDNDSNGNHHIEVHEPNDTVNSNNNENVINVAALAKNSASQIKKFASCVRLWGWEYLEGIKPPAPPAAALGNGCHSVLEGWLSQGIAPDPGTREGKIVMPGLAHLPKPSRNLEVEREFLFKLRGHLYRGFVDLGYWTLVNGVYVWVVHDHKTTSDFMWALTEEELLHDVQAILYAKEAVDRHDLDRVLLSWLYMKTRGGAKAEPRRTFMYRDAIESGMEVIEHYTDQMAELRHKFLPIVRDTPHQPGEDSVVLTLEPNAYACSNFGGCPHIDRCNLTARQKMRSIMAQDGKKLSLKERMAARKAARGDDTPAETPVAVAPPAGAAAPAVNPPEAPSAEEQAKPLTSDEQAANEDKKGKGKGKGSSTTTASGDAETGKRGRGRPRGSTAKKDANGFSHEQAFVGIFSAAVSAGGEQRHMDAADAAWAKYKTEFMG